jgi:hypothetical protein
VLVRAEVLWGFVVKAVNGEAGHVRDLQVDDKRWMTRDVVMSTGYFLTSRLVLLNPRAIVNTDHVRQSVDVSLTTAQVAKLPGIHAHTPVAQQEGVKTRLSGGATTWTLGIPSAGTDCPATAGLRVFDPHLRSIWELKNYRINARRSDAGRVVDWLIDDHAWVILYAIIRTANLWARTHVLVPVRWLGPIDWAARAIHADVDAGAIIDAPHYDPATLQHPEYEARLRAWSGHPAASTNSRSHL